MINRPGERTLRVYCRCGAYLFVTAPLDVAAEVKRRFWEEHDGKGHGVCEASVCHAARLKKEQMELEDY